MYRFDDVDLELSEHNTTQLAVYDICNKAFGRRHAWLAFIDVDEFLVRAVRDLDPESSSNPTPVSSHTNVDCRTVLRQVGLSLAGTAPSLHARPPDSWLLSFIAHRRSVSR